MSENSMHPPRLFGAAVIALGAMVANLFFSKDKVKLPQDRPTSPIAERTSAGESSKALATLSPSTELRLEPEVDRIDPSRGLPDKIDELAKDIPKLPTSFIAHGKSLDSDSPSDSPPSLLSEGLQSGGSNGVQASVGLFGAGRNPARSGRSSMPAGLEPLEGHVQLPPGVISGKGLPDFSSLRSPAPPLMPLTGTAIPESNWSPTGQSPPPPRPHAVDLRWRTQPSRAFPSSPSGAFWGTDSGSEGSGAIQQPQRDR